MDVIKSWEFDSHGQGVMRLELQEDRGQDSIVVVNAASGEDAVMLSSWRDQWGVFHSVTGFTAAQEDGTRSFIDALIKALTELRQRNEAETSEATDASQNRPRQTESEAAG